MDDRNRSSWPATSFRCMDLDDIVGIMTTIIQDDGPLPMRDKKPAERIKNAADKFKEAHQAEYETRFAKSGDDVKRVHNHNTAYPKLRDELDKRRSLNKVAMPNMPNKRDGAHSLSNIGVRSKELERSRTRRKYERKPKTKLENRVRTKAIIKQRCNRKKTNLNNLKCVCQLTKARNKKDLETSRRPNLKTKAGKTQKKHQKYLEMDLDIEPSVILRNDKNSDSKEDLGYKDPDSSVISITTYASYPSTNHEPQI